MDEALKRTGQAAESRLPARWNFNDPVFWETRGCGIAGRNLWISIPALALAFAVWLLWSVVVV
ncbi:MAG: hypothetical protein FJ311_06090, partial [Rhodospirillales bacterium]|nr:hypothetical protein [Rhodospirillales bacterium]